MAAPGAAGCSLQAPCWQSSLLEGDSKRTVRGCRQPEPRVGWVIVSAVCVRLCLSKFIHFISLPSGGPLILECPLSPLLLPSVSVYAVALAVVVRRLFISFMCAARGGGGGKRTAYLSIIPSRERASDTLVETKRQYKLLTQGFSIFYPKRALRSKVSRRLSRALELFDLRSSRSRCRAAFSICAC